MLKVIPTHLVLYPSHHPHPQKVDCMLNVATDTWMSPNSHAFVAVTIHYEEGGNPRTLLLNIVECVEAHTGVTLAVSPPSPVPPWVQWSNELVREMYIKCALQ